MRAWFEAEVIDDTAFVRLSDDIGCNGLRFEDFEKSLGGARRVELIIDSIGGDMLAGMHLHSILRARETSALIVGRCYSAAFAAALGAKSIQIYRCGRILIHPPVSWVMGAVPQLLAEVDMLKGLTEGLSRIIQLRTEKSAEEVERWLDTDSFFTPEEALAAGLVDEVLETPDRDMPAERVNSVAVEQTPESEATFKWFLTAFGKIEVRDKERFATDLHAWMTHNVREAIPATEFKPL